MAITLRDVSIANFRTSMAADNLNTQFMERLGSRVRYLPARLAVGRSLSVGAQPETVEQDGKVIKGETLFGDSLGVWLAFIVQHSEKKEMSLKDLQALIAAHWARGLEILERDWETTGERDRFLRHIADTAGLQLGAATTPGGDGSDAVSVGGPLRVLVGEVGLTEEGDRAMWVPNAPAGSPHMAVMGGSGKGKTRTICAMLRGLREQASVPIVAFDFKDDLTNQYNRLGETFAANVVTPPRMPVPLDVLHVPNVDDPYDLKTAADRFSDSFFRLKSAGKGDRQREALTAAAERAFQRARPTRISDIRDSLQTEFQRRGLKHDGAMSLLNSLSRFPLFEPIHSPKDFFRQSWIIKMPGADSTEDTRVFIVNLVLDALERYLISLPNAPLDGEGNTGLRQLLFVDEAHLILGRRLPSLSSLIRQSRSKGGIVVLGSQSPDDFDGEDDDFLAQMGLIMTFATNAKPAAIKRIMAGANLDLPGLPNGMCWMRRLGDQAPVRVKAFDV